ncbi:hypothetical protein ACFKAM_005256 [Vibrio parahaemolyticus]
MQNVILKVIDAHLTLYGHFNRHEVVEVTGVGIASVSRAIKLHDGQCTYIAERKRYEANKDFKPVFPKLEHMRYLRACTIVFEKE